MMEAKKVFNKIESRLSDSVFSASFDAHKDIKIKYNNLIIVTVSLSERKTYFSTTVYFSKSKEILQKIHDLDAVKLTFKEKLKLDLPINKKDVVTL